METGGDLTDLGDIVCASEGYEAAVTGRTTLRWIGFRACAVLSLRKRFIF